MSGQSFAMLADRRLVWGWLCAALVGGHDVRSLVRTTPAVRSRAGLLCSALTARPRPPSTAAVSPAVAAEPRIGALRDRVFVRKQPRWDSPEIGVFRSGQSVRLAGTEPVASSDCKGGWYAVKPWGFVCLDAGTTLALESAPLLAAKQNRLGHFDQPNPYSYSESLGAPLYRRLPKRLDAFRAALDGGDSGPVPELFAGGRISPWSALNTPGDLRAKVKVVPARSTIAWTDEFAADGRSWLVTVDLLLTPKDRTRRLSPSTFEGARLGRPGNRLPLAFIRKAARRKFRLVRAPAELVRVSDAEHSVHLVESDETWPRLSWVELTGRARYQGGVRFLQTRERARWIRADEASLVERTEPAGVQLEPGEKWLDVSIDRGTLVAYEGTTPVFATLISPGLNGYRREQGKPAPGTTPTGVFRIEWKHRSTTMSPDPEKMTYFVSEVQYTQFFHMPFALHAAYWHDRFGEPKSGGCVNLSPADARWLFEWTTPRVPDDWHGVRSGEGRGKGTWVRIR